MQCCFYTPFRFLTSRKFAAHECKMVVAANSMIVHGCSCIKNSTEASQTWRETQPEKYTDVIVHAFQLRFIWAFALSNLPCLPVCHMGDTIRLARKCQCCVKTTQATRTGLSSIILRLTTWYCRAPRWRDINYLARYTGDHGSWARFWPWHCLYIFSSFGKVT